MTNANIKLSLCLNCATPLKECKWLLTGYLRNEGQDVDMEFRKCRANGKNELVYITKKCGKYPPVKLPRVKLRPLVMTNKGDIKEAATPEKDSFVKCAWTEDQNERLALLYAEGYSPAQIAEIMGRTTPGIYQHIKELKMERVMTNRAENDAVRRSAHKEKQPPLRRG